MSKKKITAGLLTTVMICSLLGCSTDSSLDNGATDNTNQTGQNSGASSGSASGDTPGTSSGDSATSTAKFDITSESVEENEQTVAVKINGELSGKNADLVIESTGGNTITLNGTSVDTEADGVQVNGTTITITKAGEYVFTGTLKDGQIIVDTEDKGTVRIVLADASITSSVNSPIYVVNSKKTIVSAALGTDNTLTDAEEYTYAVVEDSEPSACIFSKDDLVISGGGALNVIGNFNNGIASKDTLEINDIELNVTAENNGIKGKDYLIIKSGSINVTAGGDGLKSDNTSDTLLGYILIEDGNITIESGEDGIQAETCMKITGGNLDIKTGDGAKTASTTQGWGQNYASEEVSIKGIKAGVDVTITGGSIKINSEDDSIHTNNSIYIEDGSIEAASGDDGIHADTALEINGGTIEITKSYEGIESSTITLNGGTINVVSSDDGINAAGGADGSSQGGRPGMNGFSSSTGTVYINGGYVYIDASGDGLDSNGTITMTGGEIYIDGPENTGNGAIDYENSFTMSGGTIIAAGTSGMMQTISTSSQQYCISVTMGTNYSGGSEFVLKDSDGNVVVSYTPSKKYNSVVISTPDIKNGGTYTAYIDGTEEGSVTVSGIVNYIGSSAGMGNPGGMGGHGDMDGGRKH